MCYSGTIAMSESRFEDGARQSMERITKQRAQPSVVFQLESLAPQWYGCVRSWIQTDLPVFKTRSPLSFSSISLLRSHSMKNEQILSMLKCRARSTCLYRICLWIRAQICLNWIIIIWNIRCLCVVLLSGSLLFCSAQDSRKPIELPL